MSGSNGDWRSAAFRQKVIFNIDEALKKSGTNSIQKERNAQDIEQHIFDKAVTRDNYMTIVARIILALSPGQNKGQPMQQNTSGGIMDPNMQPSPLSQEVLIKKEKILAQQSPLNLISTPSPKLYQSPSPVPQLSGKLPKTSQGRIPQVSSNASYPSPSPIVPSPSPLGHSPGPAPSPQQITSPSSVLSTKIPGIVDSPFNPPSNLGSAESPVKLTDKEEQLYVEKLKQLAVYAEPLRKMIAKMQNEEDKANKDSKNLKKLKILLSILGDSKERVPYASLLKVENVLVRRLGFNKQDKQAATFGHSLVSALHAKADSPQSNNTLYRMFGPTLATIHGPPICPPVVPSSRRESPKPDSILPQVVKTEIAQLANKFTVDYANDGDEDCERMALVCSINDKTLPAVPSLLIRIPEDYPYSSPYCDTKDYDSTEFFKRIRDRLKDKLSSLPRMYSFSTLLLNWESCVRYVDARTREISMDA